MNSAESSGRYYLLDEESRVNPATDGLDGIEDEEKEKRKYLGKMRKSVGLPQMFRSQGKRSDYSADEEKALSELQGLGIRRYEYRELHKATQGFNDARKIGLGGSGVVYKGMLKGQQAVAIKVLTVTAGHSEAIRSYVTEAKVMSQVRHRNVVQLLGYCQEREHLALVLELMPNGSLADHLHRSSLPWKVRYSRIAVGLASALLYLHEGSERCVLHRDINPHDILLDSEFNPKLADFALSIVAESNNPLPEFPGVPFAGTVAYSDPHYFYTGELTKASDVYAFGLVALQIASGRKAIFDFGEPKRLLEWVEELHEKGRILVAVHPNLGDEFDRREAKRLLLVGLWCTQRDPKSRPPIQLVLQLLKFEVPMPTSFISNVSKTLTEHDTPSSADRTQAEPKLSRPGVDIDATTTSVDSRTDRDTFKDIEVDDLLLESVHQEEDITPALSPEHVSFDIGIPLDFGLSQMSNDRKAYHRNILKGFANDIYEMMQSEEGLPRFDEALEKIKTYTASLVLAVGPPLYDWNTLAQLVLQFLKERENFFKFCDDRMSPIENISTLSLDADIHKCVSTINEDNKKLKNCKELLARAQEKCSSLEAELAKAQEISFSIEEQIKVVEQRITENLSSLEKGGHYAILQKHENVLSKLSSFTC